MKEIQSVLFVGTGAVGSVYAAIMADRLPNAVSVLADGERLERYRVDGFIVNGKRYDFALVPTGKARHVDLIVVGVKNYQLAQAISDMNKAVGPDTLILSLLNGITSEEELSAAYGPEKAVYGMILGIDAVREGNSVSFSSTGKIHFGDAVNKAGAWSDRVSRIASFFDKTGVPYFVPPNMVRGLWFKFMINVGINQASAVVRAPYAVFQKDPDAKAVMEAAMMEVITLSKAMGTGLKDSDISEWTETLMSLGPDKKTSMLQDIEAQRKTEVDAFAGTMIALGRTAGIDVPVNKTLYSLLKVMERY